MFVPKKTKFRKSHKAITSRVATSNYTVSFGSYGLKILESTKISSNQIETIRKVISRSLQRKGSIFIKIFPQTPVSKKPLAVRMGGGKGAVEKWVAMVPAGTVIFEIDNVSREIAHEAIEKARYKLSAKCCCVERNFVFKKGYEGQ